MTEPSLALGPAAMPARPLAYRFRQLLPVLEPAAVVVAAPFLLFPALRPGWTVAALGLLPAAWLARWLALHKPAEPTPLDLSLLLLAAMIPVGVWASALPEVTLPKLTGLILGLAAFRATVHAGGQRRGLGWAAAALLLLGTGLVCLGVLAGGRSAQPSSLAALAALLPASLGGLPGAEAGVNPNELGGTVLMVLPFTLAVMAGPLPGRRWVGALLRLVLALLALLLGLVLVSTQSRSAWLGICAGLGMMAFVRWRRARWPLVLLALLAAAAILGLLLAPAGADPGPPVEDIDSLQGRLEIWSRGVYAIQDFAFTGCGLGTFRRVVHVLYPLFLAGPEKDLGHAHNIFLQVALDLGLPGLVAYLALAGGALWLCVRAAGRRAGPRGAVALGVLGCLVALHVYGLADAIALGAKPGLAFWVLLGLAVLVAREPGPLPVGPELETAGSEAGG